MTHPAAELREQYAPCADQESAVPTPLPPRPPRYSELVNPSPSGWSSCAQMLNAAAGPLERAWSSASVLTPSPWPARSTE